MVRGLYFLTIQGSLKTGKSTLTNLLVGKDVAITQSGVDTTKTPYVITKSNDNKARIFVYERAKNPKKEKEIENVIEAIIDDVKGIELVDNKWNAYFTKREIPFSKENIEKYTVSEYSDNVLFINIQIPKPKDVKEWILDHDIAILDTPGVEGKKALSSQNVINEIKKRTNMLIAMQSTVTPINNEEIKALKEYENEGAELRHMHNRFELKPWANEYDRKKFFEAERKAINKGKEILKNEFELEDIVTNSFNLAKVEDYVRRPKEYRNLKSEYDEFVKFVQDLIFSINQIKIESKREKALTQIMNLLEKWESEDGTFLSLKKKFMKDLDDIERELKEIKNAFFDYKKNVCEFREYFFNKNSSKISEYANIKLLNETNTHLKVQNNLLNKAEKEIIESIQAFISNLNKEINELFKKYVLELLNKEKVFIDDKLVSLKNFLKQKNYIFYADKLYPPYFNLLDIPDIVNFSLSNEDIKALLRNQEFIKLEESEVPLVGKLFKNKYLLSEKFENHIKELFKKAIMNSFSSFIQDLETNIYNGHNGVLDKYAKSIEELAFEFERDFESKVLQRKEKNKQAIFFIEDLIRKIKNIKSKLI